MISSFSGDGLSIDLDNPSATKKTLAEQLKKEMGAEPDSSQVEMTYQMIVPMFNAMTFTFTADGQAIYQTVDKNGQLISDTARYTADYSKGIITTISKEGAEEKKESSGLSFENDFLVLRHVDRGEIIKLKRIK